jgi:hypothetical protein
MDVTTQEKTPRKRRYLRAWALIGAAGLITGAAYASGFATQAPVAPDDSVADGAATPVFGQEGAALNSLYSGLVSAEGALDIPAFDGTYATFPELTLFEVDLTKPDAYNKALTGTFFTDVYVTNWTDLGYNAGAPEWSQLNFKFLQSDTTCALADFSAAPAASQQLSVDRIDAHVTFSGLAAGSTYCIGLRAEDALTQSETANAAVAANLGVLDGTFITRPDIAAPPAAAPQFTAVVNRSS